MLALVTGGAGFIGSHIVDELLHRGYDVRILDALAEPVHPGNKVPDYLPRDAELIIGDVRDKTIMKKALEGVEVIFHQAAHQGYMPDYSTFFDINSVGTSMLFEILAETKQNIKKIVIASSQAVYGEGTYSCSEHGELYPLPRDLKNLLNGQWDHYCPICNKQLQNVFVNEEKINPNTQYAISKYSQELIGHNFGRRHGIPVTCLRYSITLGKRQSLHNMYTGILRNFAILLKTNQRPVIFEDGMLQRDYIHIDDVINANMCVLENAEADYQSFNVGSGISTTVLEFFKAISDIMGSSLEPIMNGEFRVGDVRHIVSSPSKLETLGWKAQKDLHEMISDYLQYLEQIKDIRSSFNSAMDSMKEKSAILNIADNNKIKC